MLSSIVRTRGRYIGASQQLACRDKTACHQLIAATILLFVVALSRGRQSQVHRPPKRHLLTPETHQESASSVLRCGLNSEKFALCNVKRTLLIFICSVW